MLVMASVGVVRAQGQGEAVPVTIQTLKLQTTDRKEISITPPSATAGYTLVLPLTAGANGSVLTSNGSGTLSWVLPSAVSWSLLGNGTIDSTLNFLGSTTAQPLIFKTNSAEAMRIRSTGQVLVTSLGGTVGATVPVAADRIVLAGADGELRQASILSVIGAGIEGNAWSLSGNTTTTAWNGTSGAYLGTKSAQPLVIATTNATAQDIRFYTGGNGATERLRIKSTGELVISDLGGATPSGPPIPDGYDRVVIANSTGQLNEVAIPALFASSGWALSGNEGLTSGGALGQTATGTGKLGTTDGTDLRLMTDGKVRMIVTSAGAITMGSTLGVTGATTLSAGAAITGATTINTTGTASTTIGNTTSATAVTINTSTDGGLTLGGIPTGSGTEEVLLLNASNKVTKTTRANLFAGSGWALTGNSITSSSGVLGSAPTGQYIGTNNAQDLRIATNGLTRVIVASDGIVSMSSSLGVTGAGVFGGNVLTQGQLVSSGGSSITGTSDITGATTINTVGTASTTIGNTSSATAVTINTGTSGGLTLGGIPTGSASDEVLLLNASNKVTKTTRANLFAGSGWALTGNASTDSTTNFIGTTDETVGRPLIVKTDGTERMRVAGGSGFVGIGTTAPNTSLDVNGALSTRPGTATANAATTAVTVGNQSFIVITSDAAYTSRKVSLSNGLQDGQRLTLLVLGSGGASTFGVVLETADANLRLSGDAVMEDGDIIELLYYSGNWYEVKRSINDN